MLTEVKVLDKGYVRVITWMPFDMARIYNVIIHASPNDAEACQEAIRALHSLIDQDDLSTVNAAYASFQRSIEQMTPRGQRVIRFMAGRDETSPFRHGVLQLEIRAPLMVARQLHTYTVACCQREDQYGWNEVSRRYVTEEPEFYVPGVWRSAPEDKKQGSGPPLSNQLQSQYSEEYDNRIVDGMFDYERALQDGMAPEQARLFLPAYALYVRWRMTISLAAIIHLLQERLPEDAQWETQEYARAIHQIVKERFPESVGAFIE